MADRRPGLGQPEHGHHDDDERRIVVEAHLHLDLAPLVVLLTEMTNLLKGLDHKMAELEGKLGDLDTKLTNVTTAFGTSIQAAIDRLAAEIAKNGAISPEAQAILDHLSADADGLMALNANLLDAFVQTPPVPLPPAPEPVPPVEPLPPEVLTSRGGRRR